MGIGRNSSGSHPGNDAYGPAFANPDADDEQFLASLSTMIVRYLFPT